MQGVGVDNDGVLVLGATNIPWELDSAIRRRFEKRIYIPLPDLPARTAMLTLRIGKTPHKMTHDEMVEIAKETEGFSGSDISVLVKDAMMEPVRKCQLAQKFKQTPEGMFEPTNPSDPMGIPMRLMDIEPSKLKAPDVTVVRKWHF